AAKVWINDLVIWEDDGLSPWRLDEGFRKIRFRQGYNTVLMRVDNGPINCTWSLLLCPPEALAL
ncbi:MAG: OmpH family outer membrane protein, partial [Kiritimatiellae bacterium]|nr:OmpH family outer membrane protein [Kiritimatiellia bacterium]